MFGVLFYFLLRPEPRDVTRNSRNAVLAMTRWAYAGVRVCAIRRRVFWTPSGTAFYFVFIFFLRSLRCRAWLFFSYILLFALIDDALLRFGASLDACLLADVTQPLRDDLWTFAVNLLIRLRRKYETKQLHFVAFFCAVFEVADTSIEFHDFMKL